MSLIEKLKSRWQLKNTLQVVLILVVFACTGCSVIVIKHLIGIGPESSTAVRVGFYLAVLPVYNLMLLGFGFLFGQFKFFYEFEKRFFKRISLIFKRTP